MSEKYPQQEEVTEVPAVNIGSTDLLQEARSLTFDIIPAPDEIIAQAQEQAKALMSVVDKQNLYQTIHGRKFLNVEGWQLLGSFVGLNAICQPSKRLDEAGVDGWSCYVEVHDRTGQIVAGADAQCCRDEKNWKTSDDFQLRSMAQTRAISKAYRTKISFIAKMAGFEATPAEEITGDEDFLSKPKPPTVNPPTATKPKEEPKEAPKAEPAPPASNATALKAYIDIKEQCLEFVTPEVFIATAVGLGYEGKKPSTLSQTELDDLLMACKNLAKAEEAKDTAEQKLEPLPNPTGGDDNVEQKDVESAPF